MKSNKHYQEITNILTVFIVTTAVIVGLLDVLRANAWFPVAASTTDVGGVIITDTTWILAESPYVLTDTIIITAGVTLTVEPGVVVMSSSATFIQIAGHLEAVGTVSQPITFTSSTDSGAGEWLGLDFYGGTGRLQHTVVRYAGQYGTKAAVAVSGFSNTDPVIITDSVIENNLGYPLRVNADALHRLQMSGVNFTNNVNNRVLIRTQDNNGVLRLSDNAVLSGQTGLDGYEISPTYLTVPSGITLTLQAGATIIAAETVDDSIYVKEQGHLEVEGTAVSPVTFTSLANSGSGDWVGIFLEGSAHLNYTTFKNSRINIFIYGAAGGDVVVENSIIGNSADYGMYVYADALHRLELSNVTFTDSVNNRVLIETDDNGNQPMLSDNATLSGQPGLAGYEIATYSLKVPAGITLTLQAGTTIMASEQYLDPIYVMEQGHLEAEGTTVSPVTFTSLADSGVDDWVGIFLEGSAHLNYTTFKNSRINMFISGSAGGDVIVENSIMGDSSMYAMVVEADALHRLQLSNTLFEGSNRRILIGDQKSALTANVTLSSQPGLQGYEIQTNMNAYPPGSEQILKVPQGITLTMESGITVTAPANGRIVVEGHLEAVGTAVSPIIFTSITDTAPSEWIGMTISGTADLQNTHIRYAQQNLTIEESGQVTLTGSRVNGAGGNGIHNSGVITVANSVIFENGAGSPNGGIYNDGGILRVSNSTLSGNSGGGILGDGSVMVSNSTFYLNEGNISTSGTTSLRATIMQESDAWDNCVITGVLIDIGHNLSSDDSCSFYGTGLVNDVSTLNLDTLGDNGGATLTHALLPNSAALDRIPLNSCVVTTDQRGVQRPFNEKCDSGAFESTDVIQITLYLPLIIK